MKGFIFKIALAGQASVGKTALLYRFIDNRFKNDYKLTVGVSFESKEVSYGDLEGKLTISDFGGQERFKFMRNTLYSGAKGVIYIFDLTRSDTLNALSTWIQENKQYNPKQWETCVGVLVGNKSDLSDAIAIDDDMINEFINNNPDGNIKAYYKTSAKDGSEVNEMFNYLTKQLFITHIKK